MPRPRLIAATLSVLDTQDRAHPEGLRCHLEDVWSSGMDGILIGGTMGLMQLLTEAAYRDVVNMSVDASRGRGEVFVGVGDTSLARTLDRVSFVNRLDVDGIVVLTPYLFSFSEPALLKYYHAVADAARMPVYLYDLPGLTKMGLSLPLVRDVMKHPNIHGIKCSGGLDNTLLLRDALGDSCRVIVALPTAVHGLTQAGFNEHLDGIFAVAPQWSVAVGKALAASDDLAAASCQRRLNDLLRLVREYSPFPAVTAIMNARGIPGQAFCAPFEPLSEADRERLLNDPVVRELTQNHPCEAATAWQAR